MRFDVVIGNPPYQEMTGGGAHTESAKPIYNEFIDMVYRLNPRYTNLLIPSRWLSGGGAVLDTMRNKLIKSKRIKSIYHYEISTMIFKDIEVTGGVQFLLLSFNEKIDNVYIKNVIKDRSIRDREEYIISESTRPLDKYTYIDSNKNRQLIAIIENMAISILNKVEITKERFDDCAFTVSYFGIETNYEGENIKDKEMTKVRCSNNRIAYIETDKIKDANNILDKFKVCVSTLSMDRGGLNGGKKLYVISKPIILNPYEVCTSSFVMLGVYDTLEEAKNTVEFFKTKFIRFLIQTTISSTHFVRRNLKFVPLEDMRYLWTDDRLYKKYNISEEEVQYINNSIDEIS